MKKIIFDLDDTLIMWKSEYYDTLNETLDYFNIKYEEKDIYNLKKAVDDYENNCNIYKEEYMLEIFKKYTSLDLPFNFVTVWIEYLKNCYPKIQDEGLLEVLEYLSKKYELVVLTNWFTKSQKERLNGYGILKYFKDVIGTDNILNKPNKEAFIKACGNTKVEDCIMVGDNFNIDILGAYEVGLEAIWLNLKGIVPKEKIKVKQIKSLVELKECL